MPNLDPFTVVLVLFGVLGLGIITYFVYNLTRPKVTRKARVTGKRKGMSSRGGGASGYHCTFEFEDGQREEFDVSVDTYVALAPNDVGHLVTKGVLFWGFRREGDGGQAPAWKAVIPEELLAQITEDLFRGQKIKAIKLYRECTGAGLAEAKAAVDQLEAELRAAEPDKFGGQGGG